MLKTGTANDMYTGGCLCGSVRFEIKSPIRNIVYCHCSQCRKAQGSAFATNGVVSTADFDIVSGADSLTGYESTPGQTKYFCKICGSPILSKTESRHSMGSDTIVSLAQEKLTATNSQGRLNQMVSSSGTCA
jgi:hypothetical protein